MVYNGITNGITINDSILVKGKIAVIQCEDPELPESTTVSEGLLHYEYKGTARRIVTLADVSNPNGSEKVHAKALWDTGATESGISAELADMLGLRPIPGVSHVSLGITADPVETDLHKVNLDLNGVVKKKELVVVRHAGLSSQKVDFVIGMDIISEGRFTIDSSSGNIQLTFELNK